MRTRTVISTIAIATLLSTSVITPANAFVDVVTQTSPGSSPTDPETRSCTLISDEHLSPAFNGVLGIVSVFADAGATIDALPFSNDLLTYWNDPQRSDDVPPELASQLNAEGFTTDDAKALVEAIRAHRVMSGNYGASGEIKDKGLNFIFSMFFRQSLVPNQTNIDPGFSYLYPSITSEKTMMQVQERFKTIDYSSFERFLVTLESGSGGKTDARYEKASPKLKALYEASYEKQKPTIRQLVGNFTSMSYKDYLKAKTQRQALVEKTSSSCGKWIDGSIPNEDVLHYAGTATDYQFSGFALDSLVSELGGSEEPGDNTPDTQKQSLDTNSSSQSTSAIMVIVLALVAVVGGIGAWLAGMIPGIPKPAMPPR